MSLTAIIVLSVIILLVIIGATQRKKLINIVKAETNSFLKQISNKIKLAELKLDQLKISLNNVVDSASELFAQEKQFIKDLESCQIKINDYKSRAKNAKDDKNDSKAKELLALMIAEQKYCDSVKVNLDKVISDREKLESSVSKLKSKIKGYELQIKSLKARKATNSALTKASESIQGLSGETFEDSLYNIDVEITADESKLEYKSDDLGDEIPNAEVNKEFENL